MRAKEIIRYMESLQDDEQRQILMGFFKTGPGEYGEGDEFLGLKVPQTREVVKAVPKDFPLSEVTELLMNRWHEVRLCGLLILVAKFERLSTKKLEHDTAAIKGRDEILTLYLQYAGQANNWDLVDLSVHKILGHWLLLPTNLGDKDYKIRLLDDLAQSPCLWKQRMSIVCSWKTSQMGDPSWCLRYAEIHLHHPHDLMHKAVGWMLREMGKRVSMNLLRDFLRQHAHEMPRTMLRYAIEKMPEQERQYWMNTETIARNKDGVEYHPLRPFLPENAKVLFLGSFPPQRKRWCMDFYYPNYINDHWRLEGQIFFNDKNHFVDVENKRFKKDEIVAFCQEKGLAFYDTSTAIRRLQDNASDKFLEVVEPTDIRGLLSQLPHCRAIVTTGEKATETVCTSLGITNFPKVNTSVVIPDTYNITGDKILLYRLPSSSRAYPLAFDKKVEAYHQMFKQFL